MNRWYQHGQPLLNQIHSLQLREDELALWFIGQCGFIFKTGHRILLIDPVLNDITGPDGETRRHYPAPFAPDALKPDYVLCTHGHIDHLAPPTISAIAAASPETCFLLPAGCCHDASAPGIADSALIPMQPGSCAEPEAGIRIQAFSAAHPSHVSGPDNPDMALGYCLDLGGIRILHLGDTYLTEPLLQSLAELGTPDVFLPPINGDDLFRARRNCIGNMGAEEAAALAVQLHAGLSMPTHYDMIHQNNADPLRFAAELCRQNPAARWKIPALGECVIIRR